MTVNVVGRLRIVDHPGPDDATYDLTTGSRLDLVQLHSTDRINFIGTAVPSSPGLTTGPYNATFNLTSEGGSTDVNAGTYGQWSGTIHIHNGTLTSLGASHSGWINTGDSVISGNSSVHMRTMTGTGGTMELDGGATLEWTRLYSSIPVALNGGTLILDTFFPGTAGNITFNSQSHAHMDELDLTGVMNAASWSMKDDLLQVFDAAGGVISSVDSFHNNTGKPIQVDQRSFGVAVIADATPHAGMIPIG